MPMLTKKEFEDIVLTVFKRKDSELENLNSFDELFLDEEGNSDEDALRVKEGFLEIYEEISKLEESKIIQELNEQE